MPDTPFLHLSARWRLAFDSRQWIMQQRTGKDGTARWKGRKFVPTTTADLRLNLQTLNIRVCSEAARELDAMPPTFGEFLEQRGVDRPRDDVRSAKYGRDRRNKGRFAGAKAPHSDVGDSLVVEVPEPSRHAPAQRHSAPDGFV